MSPELRLLLGLGLCVTTVSLVMLALRLWTARQRRRYLAPDYRRPLARPDGYQRQADLNEWARQQERRGRPKLGLLLALLPLLLLGCGVPQKAIDHAEKCRDQSKGHMNDEQLPAQARTIGRVNYDSWCVQLESLDGRPLPPDVAERAGPR